MSVYDEVKAQREHARTMRGGHEVEDLMKPDTWLLHIEDECQAAEEAESDDEYRRALIKIASLAIGAIESLDRNTAQSGAAK